MSKLKPGKLSFYTGRDAESFSDIAAIQERPAMFVGQKGTGAAHHLGRELVTNVSDEFGNGRGNYMRVTINEITNSIMVEDNGNGIPVDSLVGFISKTNAGAKFSSDAYSDGFSGGQNGVGLTATNALAEIFWTRVKYMDRDEKGKPLWKYPKQYYTAYEKGKCVTDLTFECDVKDGTTGTTVYYQPNREILGSEKDNVQMSADVLINEVKYTSYCNPGLKVDVDVTYLNGKTKSFTVGNDNGIIDFLNREVIKTKSYSVMPMVVMHHRFDDLEYARIKADATAKGIKLDPRIKDKTKEIDLVFTYAKNAVNKTDIVPFCNSIVNMQHGTHVDGTSKALCTFFIDKLRTSNFLSTSERAKYGKKIKPDDVLNGLVLTLHAKCKNPDYEGQTKHMLHNSDMADYCESAILDELGKWYLHNQQIARQFMRHIFTMCKVRLNSANAANQTLSKVKRVSTLDQAAMTNFRNCRCKKPEMKELFIVEGESASGPVGDALDVLELMNQAMFLLKGKFINAEKETKARVAANAEVKAFNSIIGCGWGENLDMSKLRFHKIICLADADADGAHINALLLTFLATYYMPLIEAGMVYIANPPLYRIKMGKNSYYIPDDPTLDAIKDKAALMFFDLVDKKGNVAKFEFFETYLKKCRGYISNLRLIARSIGSQPAIVHAIAMVGNKIHKMKKLELMNGYILRVERVNNTTIIRGNCEGRFYTTTISDDFFTRKIRSVVEHLYDIRFVDLALRDKKSGYTFHNDVYVTTHLLDLLFSSGGIERYKGLGEMKKEQVRETCTDPTTRNLRRVTIADLDRAKSIVHALMGPKVELRKEYWAKDTIHM